VSDQTESQKKLLEFFPKEKLVHFITKKVNALLRDLQPGNMHSFLSKIPSEAILVG
jgi:hypothetical protein